MGRYLIQNDNWDENDDNEYSDRVDMTVQRVSLPPLPTRRSVPYSSFIIITFVAYLCHRHYDTICRYLYIPPGPPPPIELYHKYHHHKTSNEPTTPKTEEALSHDTSSSSSSSFSTEHSHSPNTSWNEYIHEHTYQLLHSLIALGIQTPYYIITNAFHSLMVDVQDYFHRQRPFQWTITTSIQQFITTVVPHSILRIHNNHTTSQDTPLLHHCQWIVPPQLDTSPYHDERYHHSLVGQDMAVNYLRNAMSTWIQATTTVMRQLDTKPPLLVFATGYEHTGKHTLAQQMASTYRIDPTHCDTSLFLLQIQGHDWTLENYEMDYEHTERYRRRLYRKLMQFIESHYYNIKRRYHHDQASSALGHGPQPPNMILISNIEHMDSVVLLQFLTSLLRPDSPDAIDHDDPRPTVRQLCQNSIIYLTSNEYGVSAIARHLRNGGLTTTLSPSMALISDIRDMVQGELQEHPTVKIFNTVTILPFLPFTPKSLAQLLRRRITSYVATATRQISASTAASAPNHPFSSMIVTDRAIQMLTDDRNVEYIKWRTKHSRHSVLETSTDPTTEASEVRTSSDTDDDNISTTIKIVVEGANAIHDQTPIMTKLYTQLHQLLAEILPPQYASKVLLLDYDITSTVTLYDRGTLHVCDSTIIPTIDEITEHDSKGTMMESSPTTATLTNHNCQIVGRFQL